MSLPVVTESDRQRVADAAFKRSRKAHQAQHTAELSSRRTTMPDTDEMQHEPDPPAEAAAAEKPADEPEAEAEAEAEEAEEE